MSKVEKLTLDQESKLTGFIGKAALNNVMFPSRTMGTENLNIQEILNFSISSLENYGEFIEKNSQKEGSSFKSKRAPRKYSGLISSSELIEFLHIIIQYREYEVYQKTMARKIDELNKYIEDTKSPEEKRQEAQKNLLALQAELSGTSVATTENA